MDNINLSEVEGIKCVVYGKDRKRMDTITIKARKDVAPIPLPQKVLREVLALVNKKREYLSKQDGNPE